MSDDLYDSWYRLSYPRHTFPDPSYWQRWRKLQRHACDVASVLTAIMGLAVVATIVSNPNTPKLIEAAVNPPEDGN